MMTMLGGSPRFSARLFSSAPCSPRFEPFFMNPFWQPLFFPQERSRPALFFVPTCDTVSLLKRPLCYLPAPSRSPCPNLSPPFSVTLRTSAFSPTLLHAWPPPLSQGGTAIFRLRNPGSPISPYYSSCLKLNPVLPPLPRLTGPPSFIPSKKLAFRSLSMTLEAFFRRLRRRFPSLCTR